MPSKAGWVWTAAGWPKLSSVTAPQCIAGELVCPWQAQICSQSPTERVYKYPRWWAYLEYIKPAAYKFNPFFSFSMGVTVLQCNIKACLVHHALDLQPVLSPWFWIPSSLLSACTLQYNINKQVQLSCHTVNKHDEKSCLCLLRAIMPLSLLCVLHWGLEVKYCFICPDLEMHALAVPCSGLYITCRTQLGHVVSGPYEGLAFSILY